MAALRFTSHGLTHIGRVRQRNEDAFLERPDLGIWAVADGMGGHEAGDFASASIVTALGAIEPASDLDALAEAAAAELAAVDGALRSRAAKLGPFAVIASTVVVLLVQADELAALWAGDSRIYRWRAAEHGGELRRLSKDHSKAQEMVDAGLLRPEQMTHHPHSNIVTRSVGAGPFELGRLRDRAEPGDRFLLCSDGLTTVVNDAEIAAELAASPPRDAALRLRDHVLARGAPDNVTIVIVHADPVM
jgi:serine/threonine protein phosphatase PrpC